MSGYTGAGWSRLSFMWFHRKKEPYLPDGRNAETFAPHRSCCTGTCLDSRRKPGNSPPVGPANWSGCPLCSSSSPGTEECNRMPVYPRTWFGYDECIRRKVIQWSFYPLYSQPRFLSSSSRSFFWYDLSGELISTSDARTKISKLNATSYSFNYSRHDRRVAPIKKLKRVTVFCIGVSQTKKRVPDCVTSRATVT